LVIVLLGRTSEVVTTTLLLDDAVWRILFLNIVELMKVFAEVLGASDGDFMVFADEFW
jgi:hypothetical protein